MRRHTTVQRPTSRARRIGYVIRVDTDAKHVRAFASGNTHTTGRPPLDLGQGGRGIRSRGLVTSTAVGAALGYIGLLAHRSGYEAILAYALPSFGAALVVREAQVAHFSLPQFRRQTRKMWSHDFGIVQASAMWGAHIGLTFATWMANSGYWFVALSAIRLGTLLDGTILFVAYWLGRCMPLAVGPAFGSAGHPPAVAIVKNVIAADSALRQVHVVGLAFGILASLVVLR